MSQKEPKWWYGHIVAHVADGKSLVWVDKNYGSDHRLNTEIAFPTELIPVDCQEIGTKLLVSWNPWLAKAIPENSN